MPGTAILPPLLLAPLSALIFLWFIAALGYRTARILRLRTGPFEPYELGLVYLAVGAGIAQAVPLLLAALTQLYARQVRWTCLALVVALLPDAVGLLVRGGRSLRQYVRRPSPAMMMWIAALALLLAILLVHAVVIHEIGDDDGYHLTAPERWLLAGSLTYLPTLTHTTAPMGFEMLYLLALPTIGAVGAKVLHFHVGVLLLATVVAIARRLGAAAAGVLAVSLLLVANPIWNVPALIWLAYNDLAVCWMAVMCLLLFLVWSESSDRSVLTISALCAGFAGSYKFTALVIAAALGLVVLVRYVKRGASWREAAMVSVTCGLVAVVPVLPWLLRNYLLTNNPLYPIASTIIPTHDWSAEQARVFGLFFRYYNWAKEAGSRLSLEQRQQQLVVAAIGLTVTWLATYIKTRRPMRQDVLLFAYVVLAAALALTGLYFRFWLPAIVCLAVVGACVVVDYVGTRATVWLAVVVLCGALGLRVKAERTVFAADWRMATGRTTQAEEFRNDPLWRVWRYIDATSPPDTRVLISAFYTTFGASSGGTFWMRRQPFVTDSHLQGYLQLGEWDAFLRSVERAKIDWVVISTEQFAAGRHGFSFPAQENEYPFCRRLVAEHGVLLAQFDRLQIYRLRSDSGAAQR